MFKYNKTESFFFKFMSPILNIGFSQNFPTKQPAKINLVQAGKYFTYEREEIISFSWLSGKTTGKLFPYEQPLSVKNAFSGLFVSQPKTYKGFPVAGRY